MPSFKDNVLYEIDENNILTMVCDLKMRIRDSKTGKTRIIASSGGKTPLNDNKGNHRKEIINLCIYIDEPEVDDQRDKLLDAAIKKHGESQLGHALSAFKELNAGYHHQFRDFFGIQDEDLD